MSELFAGNKLAVVGTVLLMIIIIIALIGPLFTPYSPTAIDLPSLLEPPSPEHLFGTDQLGRDILTRVIHGAQISLGIGLVVTIISLAVGTFLGLLAGYSGGVLDLFFVWLFDTALAIPGLLLAIAIIAVLGPSTMNLILALSVMGWVGYARLARGLTLRTREVDYVAAAQVSGAGSLRILTVHILPNIIGPLIVQATIGMAGVIITESTLSFLGLAGEVDAPSWGAMLNDGLGFILSAPHLTIFPGIAIAIAVLALNFLGDGLRDRFDPRGSTQRG